MKLGKDGVVRQSLASYRLPQHFQAKLPGPGALLNSLSQDRHTDTTGRLRQAAPTAYEEESMTHGRCPRSTRTPKPRLEGRLASRAR